MKSIFYSNNSFRDIINAESMKSMENLRKKSSLNKFESTISRYCNENSQDEKVSSKSNFCSESGQCFDSLQSYQDLQIRSVKTDLDTISHFDKEVDYVYDINNNIESL